MNKFKFLTVTFLGVIALLFGSANTQAATRALGSSGHASYRGGGYYHGGYYRGGRYWHGGRYYGGGYPGLYFGFGYPYYGYCDYPYGYYPYGGYGYGYYPYGGRVYNGRAVDNGNNRVAVDVQRALAREGYYHGAIDGVIGEGTRRAIRSYERSHNLRVTGQISGRLLSTMDLG
jgi:hypothetical protein